MTSTTDEPIEPAERQDEPLKNQGDALLDDPDRPTEARPEGTERGEQHSD